MLTTCKVSFGNHKLQAVLPSCEGPWVATRAAAAPGHFGKQSCSAVAFVVVAAAADYYFPQIGPSASCCLSVNFTTEAEGPDAWLPATGAG